MHAAPIYYREVIKQMYAIGVESLLLVSVVVFSAGPRLVSVPALRGSSERQTRLTLEDLGLIPGDLIRVAPEESMQFRPIEGQGFTMVSEVPDEETVFRIDPETGIVQLVFSIRRRSFTSVA